MNRVTFLCSFILFSIGEARFFKVPPKNLKSQSASDIAPTNPYTQSDYKGFIYHESAEVRDNKEDAIEDASKIIRKAVAAGLRQHFGKLQATITAFADDDGFVREGIVYCGASEQAYNSYLATRPDFTANDTMPENFSPNSARLIEYDGWGMVENSTWQTVYDTQQCGINNCQEGSVVSALAAEIRSTGYQIQHKDICLADANKVDLDARSANLRPYDPKPAVLCNGQDGEVWFDKLRDCIGASIDNCGTGCSVNPTDAEFVDEMCWVNPAQQDDCSAVQSGEDKADENIDAEPDINAIRRVMRYSLNQDIAAVQTTDYAYITGCTVGNCKSLRNLFAALNGNAQISAFRDLGIGESIAYWEGEIKSARTYLQGLADTFRSFRPITMQIYPFIEEEEIEGCPMGEVEKTPEDTGAEVAPLCYQKSLDINDLNKLSQDGQFISRSSCYCRNGKLDDSFIDIEKDDIYLSVLDAEVTDQVCDSLPASVRTYCREIGSWGERGPWKATLQSLLPPSTIGRVKIYDIDPTSHHLKRQTIIDNLVKTLPSELDTSCGRIINADSDLSTNSSKLLRSNKGGNCLPFTKLYEVIYKLEYETGEQGMGMYTCDVDNTCPTTGQTIEQSFCADKLETVQLSFRQLAYKWDTADPKEATRVVASDPFVGNFNASFGGGFLTYTGETYQESQSVTVERTFCLVDWLSEFGLNPITDAGGHFHSNPFTAIKKYIDEAVFNTELAQSTKSKVISDNIYIWKAIRKELTTPEDANILDDIAVAAAKHYLYIMTTDEDDVMEQFTFREAQRVKEEVRNFTIETATYANDIDTVSSSVAAEVQTALATANASTAATTAENLIAPLLAFLEQMTNSAVGTPQIPTCASTCDFNNLPSESDGAGGARVACGTMFTNYFNSSGSCGETCGTQDLTTIFSNFGCNADGTRSARRRLHTSSHLSSPTRHYLSSPARFADPDDSLSASTLEANGNYSCGAHDGWYPLGLCHQDSTQNTTCAVTYTNLTKFGSNAAGSCYIGNGQMAPGCEFTRFIDQATNQPDPNNAGQCRHCGVDVRNHYGPSNNDMTEAAAGCQLGKCDRAASRAAGAGNCPDFGHCSHCFYASSLYEQTLHSTWSYGLSHLSYIVNAVIQNTADCTGNTAGKPNDDISHLACDQNNLDYFHTFASQENVPRDGGSVIITYPTRVEQLEKFSNYTVDKAVEALTALKSTLQADQTTIKDYANNPGHAKHHDEAGTKQDIQDKIDALYTATETIRDNLKESFRLIKAYKTQYTLNEDFWSTIQWPTKKVYQEDIGSPVDSSISGYLDPVPQQDFGLEPFETQATLKVDCDQTLVDAFYGTGATETAADIQTLYDAAVANVAAGNDNVALLAAYTNERDYLEDLLAFCESAALNASYGLGSSPTTGAITQAYNDQLEESCRTAFPFGKAKPCYDQRVAKADRDTANAAYLNAVSLQANVLEVHIKAYQQMVTDGVTAEAAAYTSTRDTAYNSIIAEYETLAGIESQNSEGMTISETTTASTGCVQGASSCSAAERFMNRLTNAAKTLRTQCQAARNSARDIIYNASLSASSTTCQSTCTRADAISVMTARKNALVGITNDPQLSALNNFQSILTSLQAISVDEDCYVKDRANIETELSQVQNGLKEIKIVSHDDQDNIYGNAYYLMVCHSGYQLIDYKCERTICLTHEKVTAEFDEAAVCTACPAGYEGNADRGMENVVESCTSCQSGKYSTGGSACTDPPAGSYVNTARTQVGGQCPSGSIGGQCSSQTSNYGGASTQQCNGDYNNNLAPDQQCAKCTAGKFSNMAGGTECSTPTDGNQVYRLNSDNTKSYGVDGSTHEESCEDGTAGAATVNSGFKCPACSAGKVASGGDAICVSCGAGKYANKASGADECLNVPAGYAHSLTEQVAINTDNTTVTGGMKCIGAEYADVAGLTACKTCLSGHKIVKNGDLNVDCVVCTSTNNAYCDGQTEVACAAGKENHDDDTSTVCVDKQCSCTGVHALAVGVTNYIENAEGGFDAVAVTGSGAGTSGIACEATSGTGSINCGTCDPTSGMYALVDANGNDVVFTGDDGSNQTVHVCHVCQEPYHSANNGSHTSSCVTKNCPKGLGYPTSLSADFSNLDNQFGQSDVLSCQQCVVGEYSPINGLAGCERLGSGRYCSERLGTIALTLGTDNLDQTGCSEFTACPVNYAHSDFDGQMSPRTNECKLIKEGHQCVALRFISGTPAHMAGETQNIGRQTGRCRAHFYSGGSSGDTGGNTGGNTGGGSQSCTATELSAFTLAVGDISTKLSGGCAGAARYFIVDSISNDEYMIKYCQDNATALHENAFCAQANDRPTDETSCDPQYGTYPDNMNMQSYWTLQGLCDVAKQSNDLDGTARRRLTSRRQLNNNLDFLTTNLRPWTTSQDNTYPNDYDCGYLTTKTRCDARNDNYTTTSGGVFTCYWTAAINDTDLSDINNGNIQQFVAGNTPYTYELNQGQVVTYVIPTDGTGCAEQQVCWPGYYSPGGQMHCDEIPDGYRCSRGVTETFNCDDFKTKAYDFNGAVALLMCGGTALRFGDERSCPLGAVVDGVDPCIEYINDATHWIGDYEPVYYEHGGIGQYNLDNVNKDQESDVGCSAIEKCPAGTYSAEGRANCFDIPAGQECAEIVGGGSIYNNSTGCIRVVDCHANSFSALGVNTCTDFSGCPVGQRVKTTGVQGVENTAGADNECEACTMPDPLSGYQSTNAPANVGYSDTNDIGNETVYDCKAWSECASNKVLISANVGTVNSDRGDCSTCLAQEFPASLSNGVESTSCEAQPACNNDGQMRGSCDAGSAACGCEGCAVGDAGVTGSCTACLPGTYDENSDGTDACTECETGKYVTGNSNTACIDIGTGKGCTSSSDNAAQDRGCKTIESCPAGEYSGASDHECIQIPAGYECSAANNVAGNILANTTECSAIATCGNTQYSAAGSNLCVDIPAGTECETWAVTTTTTNGGTTTTTNSGCTVVESCAADKFSIGGNAGCTNFVTCGPGSYVSAAPSSEQIDGTTVYTSDRTCTSCSASGAKFSSANPDATGLLLTAQPETQVCSACTTCSTTEYISNDCNTDNGSGNFNRVCSANVCANNCENGNNGDCLSNEGTSECASCNNGYHLNNVASPKTCDANVCIKGEAQFNCDEAPTTNDNDYCPTHGSIYCKTCDTGYYLVNGGCVQKVCTCSNGVAVGHTSCDNHATNQCASCNAGYELDNNECVACEAGEYSTAGGSCQTKQCTCTGGTAATSTECISNGDEDCASCNADYIMSTTNTVSTCTACPGGEYSSGGTTTSCTSHECSCANGTPSSGANCEDATELPAISGEPRPLCASCESGYYLSDSTESENAASTNVATQCTAKTTNSADCSGANDYLDLKPNDDSQDNQCLTCGTDTIPNAAKTGCINQCSCTNGNGATDTDCAIAGENDCASCDANYGRYLIPGETTKYECVLCSSFGASFDDANTTNAAGTTVSVCAPNACPVGEGYNLPNPVDPTGFQDILDDIQSPSFRGGELYENHFKCTTCPSGSCSDSDVKGQCETATQANAPDNHADQGRFATSFDASCNIATCQTGYTLNDNGGRCCADISGASGYDDNCCTSGQTLVNSICTTCVAQTGCTTSSADCVSDSGVAKLKCTTITDGYFEPTGSEELENCITEYRSATAAAYTSVTCDASAVSAVTCASNYFDSDSTNVCTIGCDAIANITTGDANGQFTSSCDGVAGKIATCTQSCPANHEADADTTGVQTCSSGTWSDLPLVCRLSNSQTCTASTECLTISYCDTICKAKGAVNAACTANEQCLSNNCHGDAGNQHCADAGAGNHGGGP